MCSSSTLARVHLAEPRSFGISGTVCLSRIQTDEAAERKEQGRILPASGQKTVKLGGNLQMIPDPLFTPLCCTLKLSILI